MRSGKINCTDVVIKFDEYYVLDVLTIMSTCTHNHEYPENRVLNSSIQVLPCNHVRS